MGRIISTPISVRLHARHLASTTDTIASIDCVRTRRQRALLTLILRVRQCPASVSSQFGRSGQSRQISQSWSTSPRFSTKHLPTNASYAAGRVFDTVRSPSGS